MFLPPKFRFLGVKNYGLPKQTVVLYKGNAYLKSIFMKLLSDVLAGLIGHSYFEPIFKIKECSPETIKGHRRILRTLFNEAVRYEWIAKNPVCKTKVGASAKNGNISIKPVEEKEVFSLA